MSNITKARTRKSKVIFKKIKAHGHHIVFVISIVSLASLVLWWSIFIRNSIQQQQFFRYDKLESDLKIFSLDLGRYGDQKPAAGVLKEDTRFEIVPCQSTGNRLSLPLEPYWPEFCLQVRGDILDQIKEETGSLNLMLIGEASVLFFVVLVSIVFLYRYIRLESQTVKEVQFFWERSAHEIKTPITGIKAFLENLKAGAFDTAKLSSYVDLALKQVEKQKHLAENILSGYKLIETRKRLRCAELELSGFLEGYFEESAIWFTKAKVNFVFNKDKRLTVQSDVNVLKTVLDNILDNAVKYCDSSLVLEIDCIEFKNNAAIVIKDNGPGFSQEFSDNIFNAYKHTDEKLPVKMEGTGMGLYLSRTLARKMGGDLKAFSEGKGKGAEFQVILRKIKSE